MSEPTSPAIGAKSVGTALRVAMEFAQGLAVRAENASAHIYDAEARRAFESLADMDSYVEGTRAQLVVVHDRAPAGLPVGWLLTVNRLQVDVEVFARAASGLRAPSAREMHFRERLVSDLDGLALEARRIGHTLRGLLIELETPEELALEGYRALLTAQTGTSLVTCAACHAVHPAGPCPSQPWVLRIAFEPGPVVAATMAPSWRQALERELNAARTCLPSRAPTVEEMAEDPSALEGALNGVREALDAVEAVLQQMEVARAE